MNDSFDHRQLAPPRHRWVAIVANPYSGSGPNRRRVLDLVEELSLWGIEARTLWSPGRRRAVLADAPLMQQCMAVVAAGGDGTINDLVNEQPDVPLATLPLGNENLFARQFGFTRDAGALARAIAEQRTRRVDLGQANDRRFTCMVSAGFDADVVHRVQRWRVDQPNVLRRVTRSSYTGPVLQSASLYEYPKLRLEADGRVIKARHVLVFNLPQYGGAMPFAPQALPDDGLLDYVVFRKPGIWKLAGYLLAVYLRRHDRLRTVHTGRARRLRITAESDAPVQNDGDPLGLTPVDIRVLPGALRIVRMPDA